jgi:imidazolonepropionase-like amidohydrolase
MKRTVLSETLRFLSVGVPLLAIAAPVLAQTTVIQCGKLIDVRAGTVIDNATIVIAGDTITAAGANVPAPRTGNVINLSKGYCLPGLMDAHDHITGDPKNSGYQSLGISIPRQTLIGVKNARTTLQAGFTTIRNVGAGGYTDVALRDAINAGDVEGPRLFVSGHAFGITGGHCDNNLFPPEFRPTPMGVADGPWAARAKVRENVKYGADLIKICASGGVLSKGDSVGGPQYSLEEMKAVVEEAHRHDRKVAAHAHGTLSIKEAILAGVDSVEHCSFIDDEGIRLAKEKGTYLVFDIYNDDYILAEGIKNGLLPENIEKEKMVGRTQRENFRKAYLAGTKLAFGTDGGVYPHGDNWKQFPHMVEWGMKPIEAIRAATLVNAELIGVGAKAGVIETGRWADIIAVDGNPLEDISRMKDVRFVMKAGKVYRNDWAGR